MKRHLPHLNNFAADLSLTNLCFLKVWVLILYKDIGNVGYYCSGSPVPLYLATMADILLLTILFFALRIAETKCSGRLVASIQTAVTIVAMGLVINGFRVALNHSGFLPPFSNRVNIVAGIILFSISGLYVLKYKRAALRGLRFVSLLFFPLFFIIGAQAAIISTYWEPPPVRAVPMAGVSMPMPLGHLASPHIIWIIFDEMDERIAFAERPPNLKLPELDRFRLQSLSADNALPPSGSTLLSMPALISSHMVEKATPASANDLNLKFTGSGIVARWGSLPSIFSRMDEEGYTSQVIGYYHPYDRIFMNKLTHGYFYPGTILADTRNHKMESIMLNVFVFLFQANVIRPQEVAYYASIYNKFHHQASSAITEPVTLTFLHYPIPHKPYYYDRNSRVFLSSFTPQTHDHYLDNLGLSDRTFGELRKKLESAGMWEISTIIVSSDHWWRSSIHYDGKKDYRVPFMVKLAGQNTPLIYSKSFNTVLTSDMIMGIVRGEISTYPELSAWLDKTGQNIQPIVPEGLDNLG